MATSGHEPLPDAIVRDRISNSRSIGFVLDVVSISRGQRDLVDTLLATSIVQANQAVITRQADLQARYAALGAPPPEELYRPVSINALATSLSLPFETVRRRVRNLAAQEICRLVDGGVIVPQSVLSSPAYALAASAIYERLRAFYFELRDADALPPTPRPNVAFAAAEPPLRTVTQQVSGYVLRVVELLMHPLEDLVSVALLFGIFRSNVEHFSPEVRRREGLRPGEYLPDALRRPASLRVATRLGLSAETARRHVAELIALGWVIRVKGGLVMTTEALARPEIARFMEENLINLHRMFSALAQLGVLTVWDSPQPPATASLRIPQNG